MLDSLLRIKNELGERVKIDEPMAKHTTLKVGGPADLFVEAKNKEDFINIVQKAKKFAVPIFILGGGSNILVGDKGVRGLVIKNKTSAIVIRGAKGSIWQGRAKGDVYVEADSGVIMNMLVRFTIEEGLSGLEMHLGLPGTVGGAMYMNSKWTHPQGYVGDVVYQATIVNAKGELVVVTRNYFQFGYDASVLQHTDDVVVSVVFALQSKNKEDLWKSATESVVYRKTTQPQGVFSPGCTFRNISKAEALSISTPNLTTSAGFLVDLAGLKGKEIGNAAISNMHANFIVNKGNAQARDIVQLIELARTKVKEKFGVTLVEEIVRVGEF